MDTQLVASVVVAAGTLLTGIWGLRMERECVLRLAVAGRVRFGRWAALAAFVLAIMLWVLVVLGLVYRFDANLIADQEPILWGLAILLLIVLGYWCFVNVHRDIHRSRLREELAWSDDRLLPKE